LYQKIIKKLKKMKEQIIEAYKEVLLKGVESVNAYTVSKAAGITEAEFYQNFGSTDAVGRHIWTSLFEKVHAELIDSETYNQYGSREKVLAYFFTFFESAVVERSFIIKTFFKTSLLEDYRKKFREYSQGLIEDGIENREIKERLALSNYYPDAMWALHLRLLHFWIHDDSANYVETEKAVEVFSRVPLEMMGENLFDSIFDSLKFTFEKFSLEKLNLFK